MIKVIVFSVIFVAIMSAPLIWDLLHDNDEATALPKTSAKKLPDSDSFEGYGIIEEVDDDDDGYPWDPPLIP